MQSLTVQPAEAGERFDRYLQKYLNKAPKSFFYKMLRKKNITLNGKKAEGNERLNAGDVINLFLSDETIASFQDISHKEGLFGKTADAVLKKEKLPKKYTPAVLYEDQDVIFLDKPAGLLSQKATPADYSANEWIIDHMTEKGELSEEKTGHFKPAVCNRLDRNTSGLLAGGKSMRGLQILSEMIRERSVRKFYFAICKGNIEKGNRIQGYLIKDEATNKVTIYQRETEGSSRIETAYKPVLNGKGITVLMIELITGKTHQIRAHLSSIGHPIIGDVKYGDPKANEFYRRQYRVERPLLHASFMAFPGDAELSVLAGKKITAPIPADFKKVIASEYGNMELERVTRFDT